MQVYFNHGCTLKGGAVELHSGPPVLNLKFLKFLCTLAFIVLFSMRCVAKYNIYAVATKSNRILCDLYLLFLRRYGCQRCLPSSSLDIPWASGPAWKDIAYGGAHSSLSWFSCHSINVLLNQFWQGALIQVGHWQLYSSIKTVRTRWDMKCEISNIFIILRARNPLYHEADK